MIESEIKYTPTKAQQMNRTITYHVPTTAQGMPLKVYLKKKGYSSQALITLKKVPGSILLNGERVYINRTLNAGDILTVTIHENSSSENIVPVELPLDIVYEDEDLLVINKAAGMPIHPSLNHYNDSLGNALAWYFTQKQQPFVFRCINRLDRETSGLTLVAKHIVSAGILSSHAASIHREYLAIVRGTVTPKSGSICAPIARKEGSILERTVDFAHGEPAVTHYHVLSEKNGHSLVSLCLETGRTHQIRVHMKYLGFPLIGDYLYNPDMEHISRHALHSHRLKFIHPITWQPMEFIAPLPQDMSAVLLQP